MSKSPSGQVSAGTAYAALLSGLIGLLEESRRSASRAINSVVTMPEIDRRIFVQEQKGKARAGYNDQSLDLLAVDLSARFGRAFHAPMASRCGKSYVAYREKVQTVSGKLTPDTIVQMPSGQLAAVPFPYAIAEPLGEPFWTRDGKEL